MRRDHDPQIARLRAVSLFADCPRPELALVVRNSTVHRARAGDVLIEQGRPARELIVLLEGVAVVQVGGQPIARLGPGDVAGEVGLLDHGPRTATVVTETEVVALVSSAHEFSVLLRHAPALTRALLQATAPRLRRATAQLIPGRGPSLSPIA
jgi:CRP/FNR family transcriptional regulator, cyclic AMP receptor protein